MNKIFYRTGIVLCPLAVLACACRGDEGRPVPVSERDAAVEAAVDACSTVGTDASRTDDACVAPDGIADTSDSAVASDGEPWEAAPPDGPDVLRDGSSGQDAEERDGAILDGGGHEGSPEGGACGMDGSAEATFGVMPNWPVEVVGKRLGTRQDQAKMRRVREDARGQIYVLWYEGAITASLQGTSILTKYDEKGCFVANIGVPNGASVFDFVVHPNGEITTVESRPLGDSSVERFILLAHYNANGGPAAEAPLRDEGTPGERRYYSTSADGGLLGVEDYAPLTQGGVFIRTSGLLDGQYGLTLAGDALYLVAPTYGVKLYSIDAHLNIAWARQIRPMSDTLDVLMAFGYPVVQDDHGRVWVAAIANPAQANIDAVHFGHSPAGPGRGSVAVYASDAQTGAPVAELGMGSDQGWTASVVGLDVRGNEVSLVGWTSVVKFDLPNHTHDTDVFLSRATLSTPTSAFYKAIDLDQDDRPTTAVFLDSGDVVVGGSYGLMQVDSGSIVEYGAGFLARLSREGNVQRVVKMANPRHVAIEHFLLSRSGDLLVGGIYDGPMTHDADTHAYAFLGRAQQ